MTEIEDADTRRASAENGTHASHRGEPRQHHEQSQPKEYSDHEERSSGPQRGIAPTRSAASDPLSSLQGKDRSAGNGSRYR